MQFLPQCIQRDLDILDHRVAFGLFIEGLFFGSFNGMLEQIVHTSNAGRFSLLDKLFAAGCNQHGLHITFRLRQVKQFPLVGPLSHFDEAFRLVELDVRKRSRRDIEVRCATQTGDFYDTITHADDGFEGLLVFVRQLDRRVSRAACWCYLFLPCSFGHLGIFLGYSSVVFSFGPGVLDLDR